MQTASIATEMLVIQDQLNKLTIGPDWVREGKDWKLAAMMECAEAIDHIGWKWWAKKDGNTDAARMEIIDILHFALSDFLCHYRMMSFERIGAEIAFRYRNRARSFIVQETTIIPDKLPPADTLRFIAHCAAWPQPETPLPIGLVFLAGEQLGLPFIQQSAWYRQKAILNTFRQLHGYKEGTYNKMWAGREDNDWLKEIAASFDWSLSDSGHALHEALEIKYEQLVNLA